MPKMDTLWNRHYISFLVFNTIAFLSIYILTPLLPVYAYKFSATESQIGFLAAAITISAFIIRPFSGPMADRGNRKHIIIFTQCATALLIISFIFAPSIAVLTIARLVNGFLFGISTTVITVSAVLVMPEKEMAKGIGFLGITVIGSQAVAPALGIFISDSWGFPALFIFAAILAATAGLAILPIPKSIMLPVKSRREREKFSPREFFVPETFKLVGLTVCFALAISTITNFLIVFTVSRSIPNSGLFFTIYAASVIAARLAVSRIVQRFRFSRIITVCGILVASGMAFTGIAYSFSNLAIAAVLIGVGHGVSSPAIQTAVTLSVSPERRGAASAMYFFGVDFAFISGAVIMGLIAETTSYGAAYMCFILPPLIAVPYSIIVGKNMGKKKV